VQQRTERIRVLNLVSFSPSGKPTSTKVLNLLIFSYNPRKEWAVFLTYSCDVSWLELRCHRWSLRGMFVVQKFHPITCDSSSFIQRHHRFPRPRKNSRPADRKHG
jgi:hypothetical protein